MMTILAAAVVLGILIIVHELGHFTVAKMTGVGVERFSIGFGPPVWSRRSGETEYRLSLFPLGGYVKMVGENPDEEEAAPPEKSFMAKSVRVRMAVVAAGPVLNLVLAVLIFSLIFTVGFPVPSARVGRVQDGSPAMQAGLRDGDLITAIEGERVRDWGDLTAHIFDSPGKTLAFRVRRGAEELAMDITPRTDVEKDLFGKEIRIGRIGIEQGAETVTRRYPPLEAAGLAVRQSWEMIALTFQVIVKIFQRAVPASTIGGPIMIVQEAGRTAERGLLDLVNLIALLSIQLGIFNLLPIPILDGGHIFFLLIEAVRGRPVSVRKREIVQQIGLILLISLFLFASYNDLVRLNLKELLGRWVR